MPAFLVPIISAIGTAMGGTFGAFLIMNAAYVATAVVLIGGLAYSAAAAARARAKAKDAYNSAQVDRLANVVTSVAPRELVLGRVRKGGPVAFRGSAGEYKEKFLMHIVIAAHEIDAVEKIYFNDEPVTLNADGTVNEAPYRQYVKTSVTQTVICAPAVITYDQNTGEVLTNTPTDTVVALAHTPMATTMTVGVRAGFDAEGGSDFDLPFTLNGSTLTIHNNTPNQVAASVNYQYRTPQYFAKVWWELGDANAVADARTKTLFPDEWTTAHRGRGIAKLICEFTYNETAFPSGIPVVTAVVRGAKVYDPRTGVTAWSENPALLLRHVYQHPYFGKATVTDDEDDRIIAAANACDVLHGYTVDGDTETRKMFTAALVGLYGSDAAPIMEDLAQAMAGMYAFAGGELYLRAGVYTAPVMTLTDSEVVVVQRRGEGETTEQFTVSPHRERAEKFNVVNARIWDRDQHYKQVALTPVKGAALITRDGAELAQEVTLSAVSYHPQAQHICGIMMRDARDPMTVEGYFNMKAYPLELFDVVGLSLERYGWNVKPFIILGRIWYSDRGIVKLTMKETHASIFNPDATFLPQGRADNTKLPRPWEIPVPVITGVFSGTNELTMMSDGTILSNARVVFAPITDQRVASAGRIEVQWRDMTKTRWQSLTIDGADDEAILVGVKDLRYIVIRARTRTSVAVSEWSDQVVHRVIGKTALPSRVRTPVTADPSGDRILLNWPDTVDLDLAFYEVRTNDSGWGDDNFLYRGRASQALVNPPTTAGASRTWYIKAADRGRRYSELARSVTYTRTAPPAPGNIWTRVTDTSTTIAKITFNWPDVDPAFVLTHYEVALALPDGTTRGPINLKASEWTTDYDWVGTATISVKAVERAVGAAPIKSAATTLGVSKVRPSAVGVITKTVVRGTIWLDWPDVVKTSLPIAGYEVRTTDTGWGTDSDYVYRGASSKTPGRRLAVGSNTFYVRSFDTDGRYASTSSTISHTHNLPANVTGLSLSRTSTQIVMVATATAPNDLKHYEFRLLKNGAGDVWATATDIVRSQTARATFRPPTLGTWRVSVRMVDIDLNESAASNSASITLPKMPL